MIDDGTDWPPESRINTHYPLMPHLTTYMSCDLHCIRRKKGWIEALTISGGRRLDCSDVLIGRALTKLVT